MKVIVINSFFDSSNLKPRHVGEVLELSPETAAKLIELELVEVKLDLKKIKDAPNIKDNPKDDQNTNGNLKEDKQNKDKNKNSKN